MTASLPWGDKNTVAPNVHDDAEEKLPAEAEVKSEATTTEFIVMVARTTCKRKRQNKTATANLFEEFFFLHYNYIIYKCNKKVYES